MSRAGNPLTQRVVTRIELLMSMNQLNSTRKNVKWLGLGEVVARLITRRTWLEFDRIANIMQKKDAPVVLLQLAGIAGFHNMTSFPAVLTQMLGHCGCKFQGSYVWILHLRKKLKTNEFLEERNSSSLQWWFGWFDPAVLLPFLRIPDEPIPKIQKKSLFVLLNHSRN